VKFDRDINGRRNNPGTSASGNHRRHWHPRQKSLHSEGLRKIQNWHLREEFMAEGDLPPQRSMALYAAGGGFGGALLAIVIAKILAGPCCCPQESPDRTGQRTAAMSSVSAKDALFGYRQTLPA
jgi:hypothetical protein